MTDGSEHNGGVFEAAAEARSVSLAAPAADPRARVRDALILNVSNRCNLRCIFCLEHGQRVEEMPSLEEVRGILLQPWDAPPSILMFMGAETFLRKDVEELVRLAKQRGIPHVGLATNGTLLRSRAQLEPLLRAGLDHLEVSVHTLDPLHAALLSGRELTSSRQRRGLALLAELRDEHELTVTINTVICAVNLRDIPHLLRSLHGDYPLLSPMVHLKYPYSVADIHGRVSLATLSDLRAAELLSSLPVEWRPRVVVEQVPLCVLAPHYAMSCELIGVVTDSSVEYDLTPPQRERSSQSFSLGSACEFAEPCEGCSVQLLCPGLAPGYLEHLGQPSECRPLEDSPAEVLRQVQAFRRTNGLDLALDLERDAVVDAVLERAGQALWWRRRAGAISTSAQGGAPAGGSRSSKDTSREPSGPDALGPQPEDHRPFREVLAEYRRAHGALAPRLTELIALRAGLQSSMVLPSARSRGGDARIAQARELAARTGFSLRVVRAGAECKLLLRAREVSARLRDPAEAEAFGRAPPCCARAARRSRGLAPAERLRDLVAGRRRVSWLMNPFLASTPFQLFRHLPCTLDCGATRDRASSLYQAVCELNPRLGAQVRRFRAAPVLLLEAAGAALLFEGELRLDTIRYSAFFRGGPRSCGSYQELLAQVEEALRKGDNLILAPDGLRVRRSMATVGWFPQATGSAWSLLDFV